MADPQHSSIDNSVSTMGKNKNQTTSPHFSLHYFQNVPFDVFSCIARQPGIGLFQGRKNVLKFIAGGSQMQKTVRHFSVLLFIYFLFPFIFFSFFSKETSPKKKNPGLDPHMNFGSHNPVCAGVRM